MDLRIETALRLARSFFGRFTGAKSDSKASFHHATSTSEIPGTIELIPGKLKARIFYHDIECEKEKIPCWSFVTEGMTAHKQKEMILTLARAANQKIEDYPRQLVDLLAAIYDLAQEGQVVDVGQSTLFSEAGVPGYKDVRGIGYVEPQGFLGVETRGVPLVASILLKGDEAKIAWDFGLTRITSLLGKMYRHYPCPTWCDLKREPVAFLGAMEESILGKFSRVYSRASYYEEQKHIYLSVRSSSRAQLRKIVEELPPTSPLALYTQPDSRANACLVWCPGADQSMAITPQGSDGSRKTGAFLAFIPEQEETDLRMVEDGFAVFLKNGDWMEIRSALLAGTDFVVPKDESTGAGLSLMWARPSTYTSPVSGDSYTSEEWTTYEPQGNAPPKELVAVSLTRTVLLSSEQTIQEYIAVDDLAGYAREVEKSVDAFFTCLEPRINRELAIQLELTSKGHSVRFVAAPELETKAGRQLSKRLECVGTPTAGGPVKFELIFNIWGHTRKKGP